MERYVKLKVVYANFEIILLTVDKEKQFRGSLHGLRSSNHGSVMVLAMKRQDRGYI